MPKNNYPADQQSAVTSKIRTGRKISNIESEPVLAEALYEHGAYTNGIMGF